MNVYVLWIRECDGHSSVISHEVQCSQNQLVAIFMLSLVFVLNLVIRTLEENRGTNSLILEDM